MAARPRAPFVRTAISALKFEYEQPLFSATEFDGRGVCVCVFGARAREHGTELHTPARRQRRAAVAVRGDAGDATAHARATDDDDRHASFAARRVATAERARVTAGDKRASADDLDARAARVR